MFEHFLFCSAQGQSMTVVVVSCQGTHPWPSNLETWFGHASLVGCKQLLKQTRCVGFPSGWMRPSDQTQMMMHGKTNGQGEIVLQTGFGMSFQAGWTRTMTRQPSFLWVSDSWLWRGQHPHWSLLIGSIWFDPVSFEMQLLPSDNVCCSQRNTITSSFSSSCW